jgi:HAD superfamily hydrolase (TIGR01509 family)
LLKGVIFDLDGTLADTARHYFPLMKKYLQALEPRITDHDIEELVGLAFNQKLESLNKKYGLSVDAYDFVEKVSNRARKEWEISLSENPGATNLVRELKEKYVKIGLATSNSKRNTNLILEKLGLTEMFDLIVTGEDVKNHKPHPEVYISALHGLNLDPLHAVAIEDTIIGVHAAKSAGLHVVALPNNYSKRFDFSLADMKIKSLEELNYSVLLDLKERIYA